MVADYYPLLTSGNHGALLQLFAGKPLVDDPRLGRVRGAEALREFVADSQAWLSQRRARVESVATTATGERVVEELLLHLEQGGERIALPVAVVAEVEQGRVTALRVYHSMWPLLKHHLVRPPLLEDCNGHDLPDVVARYQQALAEGDTEVIVAQFEPDAYAREPSGGPYVYKGTDKLREFYGALFSNAGGIALEHCSVTDDGVRCAIEYIATRWGRTPLAPQAGVAVYERGPSGLLAAARIYDDVDPPLAAE